jgi:hypothetical protein
MTPEHKKKLSDAMQKMWQKKSHRKKMIKKQEELGYRIK